MKSKKTRKILCQSDDRKIVRSTVKGRKRKRRREDLINREARVTEQQEREKQGVEEIQEMNDRMDEGREERRKMMKKVKGIAEFIKKGTQNGKSWTKEETPEDWIKENLQVEGRRKLQELLEDRGKGKNIMGLECKSEEMKAAMISNKYKLKRKDIYIENDLTYEERRIRREMMMRAKNRKHQGRKATVGEKQEEKQQRRASVGLLLAVRKNIEIAKQDKTEGREQIAEEINMGNQCWKVILTYMNKERRKLE
ncbi:hypothetical protein QAD02_020485 [Eretmocerus hayati]|uniref:Uncharacterized protein n=1 Tax=Eretmocerus hayati TaxID=131215 RepID=A0ACC2PMN5_9HYME|nr:hypothetical protein QAD02_020485 [Eretmocerus hayati]